MQGLRAKFGNFECTVANLSTTGAMLRSRLEVATGREGSLLLEFSPNPISVPVRVMRCEPVEVEMPGAAVWQRRDFAIGVMFLDRPRELAAAIRAATRASLTGIDQTDPRILVIGHADEVSRLIETTLKDSNYHPRVLTHGRYAINTAKRIGAKAVIVNLEIDPAFTARSLFDTLRSDPVTAQLPILICARNAWLQQTHRSYISDKRLRLLLVPFTPEELVAALDRALE